MYRYPPRFERNHPPLTRTEVAILAAFVVVGLITAAWPAIERGLLR